jgi:hypothetical protein
MRYKSKGEFMSDNNDEPIYSMLSGKPGTGPWCNGITCGGAQDPAPNGTWSDFCSGDVSLYGGYWIWDGSQWNIDPNGDCSKICSCCKNSLPTYPAGYGPGQRSWFSCELA